MMRWEVARLSDSAFIADLTPREKSFWRFLATAAAGVVGGGIIAAIACAAVLVGVGAVVGATQGLDAVRRNASTLVAGQVTVTSSIALMIAVLATNGPWAATFVGTSALTTGRRLMSYLTVAPRFRWRLLLCGLGLSLLVVGPVVLIGQLTDPHAEAAPLLSLTHSWTGRICYVAAVVLLLIPAAAAEEVVFRGWLLRESAGLTRNPLVLMALNGILFSAVHLDFAPDAFLTRALMGAGFVYMTLRLGGIEFSTGAHAANNILIVLFIQPLSLKPTPSTGLSVGSVFQDLFLIFSYVVMAELTARWAPLRRWSGADLGEHAGAEAAQTFA
jgi:membrane protease YdiL (CAAX protease family)